MNQEQLQTAVIMRAQDKSYSAISEATGVPVTTAFRELKKDEVNRLIKEAQLKLIKNGLEIAVDNQISKIKLGSKITRQIDNAEELAAGSVKAYELAHDSEKQLLQSIGIHNAHTQSIQVNNILVDNRQELSPAVARLISQHFAKVEGDTIDI